MATIDNVRRGRVIGKGAFGTVYAASYGGREYALKIEKIQHGAAAARMKIEKKFQQRVAAKHPAAFMPLYDIRAESETCIVRLHDRVGPDMNQWLNKNKNRRSATPKKYSAVAQIICICAEMKAAGFIHGDLYSGNIGTRATTRRTITIMGRRIPTFGVIFCAMDYGFMTHRKSAAHSSDVKQHAAEDIDNFIMSLMNSTMWRYMRNHEIKRSPRADMEKFAAMPEYQYIRDMTDKSLWLFVFQLLHPAAHCAMILPQLSAAICAKFVIVYHIPREHIMMLIAMRRDLPRALNYFADLLGAK